MENAILEFSIKPVLRLEPDGAYILPGGELSTTLLEQIGTKQKLVLEGKH